MTATQVITLTTDFGHKGPFVATMKGVILARAPEARVIDLTHEIHVHWPAEAGFWLSRAYPYFPAGSVHVAVVDPGVGTERYIVGAEFDGHIFLAPDNGLLPMIFGNRSPASAYRLDEAWRKTRGWPQPSNSLHGRDIFGPLAAELASGKARLADIGPRATELVPSLTDDPEVRASEVRGTVIAVDNFGNLITNIDAPLVSRLRNPKVRAGGRTLPLLATYGQVTPGDCLALVNSFGVVEIARAEGSAADFLGLGRGAPVIVSGETG
jgi:S-adenosylmethionine hydrolase